MERGRESFALAEWLPWIRKDDSDVTVIEFLQRHTERKPPELVAYFYCDFQNPETRDPLNMAGSLLAQICVKLGVFPAALEEAFERSKLSASPCGKRTILGAITEILIELTSQYRVAMLVDALDECEKRKEILQFFQRLSSHGRRLSLLVSSRNESDIREALKPHQQLHLELSPDSLDRDIDYYINYRLGHDSEFKWLKQSFKHAIRERIRTQAHGM